jgi:hypothetical protein
VSGRLISRRDPGRALAVTRAGDWWEHKLTPMLGTAYATTFLIHRSLLSVSPMLLFTLAAVVVGAVYVSVINDFTDRADDRLAGKPNRLEGLPGWTAPLLIAVLLLAGAVFGALGWRHQTAPLVVYAGSWIAFTAYSVPPIRLKTRGALGVVADAAGAHLFPQLLAALAVFAAARHSVDTTWVVLVGVWAMATGVRCALWHQLEDSASDRSIASATFGARHPQLGRSVGRAIAFPLELLALAGLLVRAGNPVALGLVPVYALVELQRAVRHEVKYAVVDGSDGSPRSVMATYYIASYPIGFLIGCALQYPAALAILAAQLVLFPRASIGLLDDLWRCSRGVVRIAVRQGTAHVRRTTS